MKHFEIFNETYKANLVVVIGGNKEEFVTLIKKKYDCDVYKYYSKDFRLDTIEGAHFDFEQEYPYKVIWMSKFIFNPEGVASLVHEITHHVSEMCDNRNISKKSDYDEPVAYLMEYYTREIIKKIKKK